MFVLKYNREETINIFKRREKDDIYLLDNMIPDKICDTLRNYIDRNVIGKEKDYNPHTNVNAHICSKPYISESGFFYKKIFEPMFHNIVKLFSKKYMIRFTTHEPLKLRKIFGETRLHSDNVYQPTRDGRREPTRVLSCVICLNDDYVGGELVFPCQNRKIKLKKGQVLLFPPYWTHPHCSEKLEDNTFRYTINTWLVE